MWLDTVSWVTGRHPAHKSLCHLSAENFFMEHGRSIPDNQIHWKVAVKVKALCCFVVPVTVVKRLQIYSNIFIILVIGGEVSDQTSCCWCAALFRRGSRAFPPVTAITYRDTPPRSLSRDRPTSRQNSLSRGRQSSLTRSRDAVNRSSNSGSAMQHGPQSHSVARDTVI